MNDVETDIQNKHLELMKERQLQISELKSYFNPCSDKRYKDIVHLDLNAFEEIFSKPQMKLKLEDILSLSLSLAKILEANSSNKVILLALAVLEEHKRYLTTSNSSKKNFIYKIFEHNSVIPLQKNDSIRTCNLVSPAKEFYGALLKDVESPIYEDFNSYLNFQTDKKQKQADSKVKVSQISEQFQKMFQGSVVNYYKLYSRTYLVSYCNIFL